MGQTLSSPAVDKKTEQGGDDKFMYAVSEMQGWRINMEDSHSIQLSLDKKEETNSFFAVYDGHGGASVAKYAGQQVHERLKQDPAYKEGNYPEALKNAFLGADADMKANPGVLREPSGCTAVAALVTSDHRVFVANAGDSRSVISVKGQAKPLSFDHKPQNETEKNRITAAGGYIEFGRVNGNLALARALGDFDYKKNSMLPPEAQIITADPEVTEHQLTEEDEFLVIACDGIWDCLSSQQVIDSIRLLISQGKELSEICEILCDHCLAPDTNSGAGIGCDNMTILIIALLHGKTKEEWYSWVTDRCKNGYGYDTPTQLPQLYAASRMMSFRTRMANLEERKRQAGEQGGGANMGITNNAFQGFSRILGTEGGMMFFPTSTFAGNGGLMFDDGDDSDEEGDGSSEDGVRGSSPDSNRFQEVVDSDGDAHMHDSDEEHLPTKELQGEAPPPPKPFMNGNAKPNQLISEPGGDAPSDAVKAEGLLDHSEDPLKA